MGAGISAAPTMTRQKAIMRPVISTGPAPDRVAEDQNAADDCGEIGRDRGERDDLDTGAELQAAGRRIEGDHRGSHRRDQPRADELEHPALGGVGQILERDVGDAEQRTGGHPEEHALRRGPDAKAAGKQSEPGGEEEDAAFDHDQRGQRIARGFAGCPGPR